jgi:peptide-methionine (S)-S-oxide reductase
VSGSPDVTFAKIGRSKDEPSAQENSMRPFRLLPLRAFLTVLAMPLIVAWSATVRAESAVVLPNPAVDAPAESGLQTVVFAGGCFWGVQGVFQHVKGVKQAVSGYAGGTKTSPSYEQVSTGATGHAESVQVTYDPREVSYGQLLKVFFSVAHDPTQLNRQGPDVGTQYRSAIFFANDEQKRVAQAYVDQLGRAGAFKRQIVTQLAPLTAFFPAEGYHQDFMVNHPNHMYIVINDLPKVDNLKKLFPDIYRPEPVTVAGAVR